jgi:hypothetical protein
MRWASQAMIAAPIRPTSGHSVNTAALIVTLVINVRLKAAPADPFAGSKPVFRQA